MDDVRKWIEGSDDRLQSFHFLFFQCICFIENDYVGAFDLLHQEIHDWTGIGNSIS